MSGCKILIASPTYNGDVRIEYMRSIIDLLARLRGRDTECSLLTEKATILHTMRSVMASEALADASFTHLLFVDTDMGFRPEAVLRLIDRDVPFAGVAYPYRTVPLHEKLPADLEGTTLRTFTSQLVPYAVTFPPGQKQVQIERGFCKVSTIGTGLMLIRRDVLVRMSEEAATLPVFPTTNGISKPNTGASLIRSKRMECNLAKTTASVVGGFRGVVGTFWLWWMKRSATSARYLSLADILTSSRRATSEL
jgi:hypothetical protein